MTIIDIPMTEPETATPEPTVIDFAPLIKARLREKGWKQFGSGDEQGPNCIMGAVGRVARAVFGEDGYYDNCEDIDEVFGERLAAILNIRANSFGFLDVEEWNDAPGRTLDDVFDLLDKADLKVPVTL